MAQASDPNGNGNGAAGVWSPGKVAAWAFLLSIIVLFGVSAFMAWRWLDQNALQWGVEEARETTTIDRAELVRRVRAFELTTVKHTYNAETSIAAAKVLNAGPVHVTVPGLISGQEMRVRANVTVGAGVDLQQITADDMEIIRDAGETRVIVRTPAPEVLSTELEPGTLDISTSAGIITRIRQTVGLPEKDLRDRSVDAVVGVAQDGAIEKGILREAQEETERRLQALLQSLPQPGTERVTYVVVTPASAQTALQ
jgi:hypothetical protein